MQIDYTAKRSVQGGHTADLDYSIEVVVSQADRSQMTVGAQAVALSGNTVTTVHRRQSKYTLKTDLISTATTPDIDDMREFLDSVSSGETFQLDISGASVDYILDSISNPYTESRVGNSYFTYSFTVRAL